MSIDVLRARAQDITVKQSQTTHEGRKVYFKGPDGWTWPRVMPVSVEVFSLQEQGAQQ